MGMRALVGITAITGEFTQTRSLVRLRRADVSTQSVTRLIDILNGERFSGTVVIEMSQGGVRSMTAEDRKVLSD